MSTALLRRLVLIALLDAERIERAFRAFTGLGRAHHDCDCMECLPWTY